MNLNRGLSSKTEGEGDRAGKLLVPEGAAHYLQHLLREAEREVTERDLETSGEGVSMRHCKASLHIISPHMNCGIS